MTEPLERVLVDGSAPATPEMLLERLGITQESPALAASAWEFVLEGLHLSRRLNKTTGGSTAMYGIG